MIPNFLSHSKAYNAGIIWLSDQKDMFSICKYSNKFGELTFMASGGFKIRGYLNVAILSISSNNAIELIYHFLQVLLGRLRSQVGAVEISCDDFNIPLHGAARKLSQSRYLHSYLTDLFIVPLAKLKRVDGVLNAEKKKKALASIPCKVEFHGEFISSWTEGLMHIHDMGNKYVMTFTSKSGARGLWDEGDDFERFNIEVYIGKKVIQLAPQNQGILINRSCTVYHMKSYMALFGITITKDVSYLSNVWTRIQQLSLWYLIKHIHDALDAKADIIKKNIKLALANPYTKLGARRLLREYNELSAN